MFKWEREKGSEGSDSMVGKLINNTNASTFLTITEQMYANSRANCTRLDLCSPPGSANKFKRYNYTFFNLQAEVVCMAVCK